MFNLLTAVLGVALTAGVTYVGVTESMELYEAANAKTAAIAVLQDINRAALATTLSTPLPSGWTLDPQGFLTATVSASTCSAIKELVVQGVFCVDGVVTVKPD